MSFGELDNYHQALIFVLSIFSFIELLFFCRQYFNNENKILAVCLSAVTVSSFIFFFLFTVNISKYNDHGYYFSEGLLQVQNEDNLWGYINKKGALVIPFKYEYAEGFNFSGAARVRLNGETFHINDQEERVEYQKIRDAIEQTIPGFENYY
jgi:hypothetical protein